jgi:hypothetical protein
LQCALRAHADAADAIVSFNVALRTKLLIGPSSYTLAENPHYVDAFSDRHWNPAKRRHERAAVRSQTLALRRGGGSKKAASVVSGGRDQPAAAQGGGEGALALDSSEDDAPAAVNPAIKVRCCGSAFAALRNAFMTWNLCSSSSRLFTSGTGPACLATAEGTERLQGAVEEWQDATTAEAEAAAATAVAEAPVDTVGVSPHRSLSAAQQGGAQAARAEEPAEAQQPVAPPLASLQPRVVQQAGSMASPAPPAGQHGMERRASRPSKAQLAAQRKQHAHKKAKQLFDHEMDLEHWDLDAGSHHGGSVGASLCPERVV